MQADVCLQKERILLWHGNYYEQKKLLNRWLRCDGEEQVRCEVMSNHRGLADGRD